MRRRIEARKTCDDIRTSVPFSSYTVSCSFIFSERTWTATMQRGLIRSTALRPYVAPKCWYGFRVSPLNSTRSPGSCRNYQHANLRIKPTNDKTSNSAGRKYNGVHMDWLNWTAGGRGRGREGDIQIATPMLLSWLSPGPPGTRRDAWMNNNTKRH